MKSEVSVIQPLQRRISVGANIAARLQTLIQDGTFKPGERLPVQRELARQFGTSLAGVREAISVLNAAGLVEATPGRGTIVRSATEGGDSFDGWLGMAADDQELVELVEAREMLEAFTIRRAALYATTEQIQELRDALDEMRHHLNDLEAYVQADMHFHLLIAQIAGNRIVTRLMRVIQRPLAENLRSNVQQLSKTGKLPQSFATHERIVEGIEKRDAKYAQQAFAEMLRGAMESIGQT